jgi:hypothetical protein
VRIDARRRYQQRYVFGAMLSVAVQRDDDIGTAGERGSITGPQRRRLAAVDLMSQQRHRQSFERDAGSVGRTIVDDDDRFACCIERRAMSRIVRASLKAGMTIAARISTSLR